MPIYYPTYIILGKYKPSICFFSEFVFPICAQYFAILKMVHNTNVHTFNSKNPVLDSIVVCFRPLACNNTALSVPFLNEILFLHYIKHLF